MLSGQLKPIKEIYEGLYDGPHATPKPSSSGPVFLGIKNVTKDGRLDLSAVRHIAEEDFSKWTKRVEPSPGDIVFTYEATLNRYAIIPPDFRGCLGRRMALIRTKKDKVDNRYLYYYFFSPEWRATIKTNTLSGSTVDRIPLTRFPDFPVRIREVPIQQKIAATLGAYDDLITNNYTRIEKLRKSIDLLYIKYFLAKSSSHIETTISSLGTVVTGKTPSKARSEYYALEGMMFIKTPDMHKGLFVIDTSEKLSQLGSDSQHGKTLPKNTICLSCIGTVGVVSITTAPSQTNQQINAIILNDQRYLEYVVLWLQKSKRILENLGSNGATMTNISKSKVEGLELPEPPIDVITEFHELAAPMFGLIHNIQKRNEKLKISRDLLLPRLISGEIKV